MKLGAIAGALCALMATPAGAWSIGITPDHKVDYAVCETRKLADYVNDMWAQISEDADGDDRFITWDNFDIITDKYGTIGERRIERAGGKVLRSGEDDFVTDLRMSFGKADEGPIKAHRLVRLVKSKKLPVYIFQFQRKQWQVYTYIPDLTQEERYELTTSTWLIQFRGNHIELLREANELAPLAEKKRNLLDRTPDCSALEKAEEED